jgi:hypothetical protein
MGDGCHIGRLAVAVLVLGGLGCAAGTGCREQASGPPRVVLTGRGGQAVAVKIEVVRRPHALRQGLMYRDRLAADAGMLFVYPAEAQRSFWMKNTYIPLDIVFIGANRRIVGIVRNAKPLTTAPRRVDAPSRFVLEVNAGFTRRHGVRTGGRVRFENVPGL